MTLLEYILFVILGMWLLVGLCAMLWIILEILFVILKLSWLLMSIPARLIRRFRRAIP